MRRSEGGLKCDVIRLLFTDWPWGDEKRKVLTHILGSFNICNYFSG